MFFFIIFRLLTTFSRWREKKGQASRIFYIHRAGKHHPSPPFTTHHHHHPFARGRLFFSFFSLPSVAPRRFGPRRAARASPRTGFHFFARMSLRDRMRLRFPMSPGKIKRLITHASCRSCAANAPNRNARIAQPLALTTFTLLFATTARETETRKHEVPHRRSAL